MMVLESGLTMQSWVNREYRRGLCTHPWGAPVLRISGGGDVVPYPHHLGAAHQEVQYPVAQGGVETQGLELDDELGGHYGVKCRAVVDEQHSHIGIPLVQMG